ncbi:dTDP-4-dehydrorhamnose 3%2C5-epimerase [Mycobacterium tuberculosis]|nr:dTDP-4-dehydrorhamnose 3%2C5-epimerase [Mycobacterium tuberculosis]
MYMCSSEYNPEREHTISAMDPTLAIDWPLLDGVAVSLSDRDAAAPSFEEVRQSGVLPTWDETQSFIDSMRAQIGG